MVFEDRQGPFQFWGSPAGWHRRSGEETKSADLRAWAPLARAVSNGFVIGDVGAEQRFEQFAVVRNLHMQQLVDDDVFAEVRGLVQKLFVE